MQKVTDHSTQRNVKVKKYAGSSECLRGKWDNHDHDVPQRYCCSGRALMYARLQHGYHAAVNCLDLCYVALAFENCNVFHTFKVPRFPVPRFQRLPNRYNVPCTTALEWLRRTEKRGANILGDLSSGFARLGEL